VCFGGPAERGESLITIKIFHARVRYCTSGLARNRAILIAALMAFPA